MHQPAALVCVVDDDVSVREGLADLIRSAGWAVEVFSSAHEFLARGESIPPSCLVLDVRLPGLSGLDLQARLAELGEATPIVFITGHGDVPMSVRAMKAGAVEFLTKPFEAQELLDGIERLRCRRRVRGRDPNRRAPAPGRPDRHGARRHLVLRVRQPVRCAGAQVAATRQYLHRAARRGSLRRTGDSAVEVQITGVGPTGTRYIDPHAAPSPAAAAAPAVEHAPPAALPPR